MSRGLFKLAIKMDDALENNDTKNPTFYRLNPTNGEISYSDIFTNNTDTTQYLIFSGRAGDGIKSQTTQGVNYGTGHDNWYYELPEAGVYYKGHWSAGSNGVNITIYINNILQHTIMGGSGNISSLFITTVHRRTHKWRCGISKCSAERYWFNRASIAITRAQSGDSLSTILAVPAKGRLTITFTGLGKLDTKTINESIHKGYISNHGLAIKLNSTQAASRIALFNGSYSLTQIPFSAQNTYDELLELLEQYPEHYTVYQKELQHILDNEKEKLKQIYLQLYPNETVEYEESAYYNGDNLKQTIDFLQKEYVDNYRFRDRFNSYKEQILLNMNKLRYTKILNQFLSNLVLNKLPSTITTLTDSIVISYTNMDEIIEELSNSQLTQLEIDRNKLSRLKFLTNLMDNEQLKLIMNYNIISHETYVLSQYLQNIYPRGNYYNILDNKQKFIYNRYKELCKEITDVYIPIFRTSNPTVNNPSDVDYFYSWHSSYGIKTNQEHYAYLATIKNNKDEMYYDRYVSLLVNTSYLYMPSFYNSYYYNTYKWEFSTYLHINEEHFTNFFTTIEKLNSISRIWRRYDDGTLAQKSNNSNIINSSIGGYIQELSIEDFKTYISDKMYKNNSLYNNTASRTGSSMTSEELAKILHHNTTRDSVYNMLNYLFTLLDDNGAGKKIAELHNEGNVITLKDTVLNTLTQLEGSNFNSLALSKYLELFNAKKEVVRILDNELLSLYDYYSNYNIAKIVFENVSNTTDTNVALTYQNITVDIHDIRQKRIYEFATNLLEWWDNLILNNTSRIYYKYDSRYTNVKSWVDKWKNVYDKYIELNNSKESLTTEFNIANIEDQAFKTQLETKIANITNISQVETVKREIQALVDAKELEKTKEELRTEYNITNMANTTMKSEMVNKITNMTSVADKERVKAELDLLKTDHDTYIQLENDKLDIKTQIEYTTEVMSDEELKIKVNEKLNGFINPSDKETVLEEIKQIIADHKAAQQA